MMRLPRHWLKPPGSLLIALFLLTLASVSALAWFGWRFLEQERLVEAQRAQQNLEQTADGLATRLRGSLAETADRLTDAEPRDEGVLLVFRDANTLSTQPPGQLLYLPFAETVTASPAAFASPEMFEFVQNQPAEAIRAYQRLADSSPDASIRAGALLRLARVLRNTSRVADSRAIWRRLASAPNSAASVAGIPVQLAALLELGDTGRLLDGLRQGRWRLSRSQFEFYWAAATKVEQPPAEALAISEAAARVWQLLSTADTAPRGQEIVWAAARPWLVIWRATAERRAVLLANPDRWLRHAAPPSHIEYALVDAQGRTIAGKRVAPAMGRAAILPAAETQLPWTIYAASVAPASAASLILRQRYLLSGVGVMVVFLILGTYFIARAIRREAEVSRMQSDFVSSVSHEFRSPITTMRQLSEILALGRIPSEERRQLYYETLVRETTRLQRVVEALLNFGQMESGTRSYRFEQLDVASVIRRAVSDFQQELTGSARPIELHQPEDACTVDADREAIAVALRNLLDNAVKYSPEPEPVILEWRRQNGHVAIAVHDHGPGVSETEQRAIFQKFVRGAAATAGNVKGSGLGLAMVRDIVAAHRGQVTVASKPGQGSTFTMLLPVSNHS
jgi:signal transduction histidine kinase